MQRGYREGDIVFGNWKIVKLIGKGGFGAVYEIERIDFGVMYKAAMKVIPVPQDFSEIKSVQEEGMNHVEVKRYFYTIVEEIVNEFALMSRLKGITNVVSYEDHQVVAREDGIGWDILIRMEILTPLLEYAYKNPFTRRDIIKLGISMCRALEVCQKYNIIHRDIKPENIFVSANEDFKLGDFGIARTIEKTTSGLSKKGTYSYMAPEVYKGIEYGFSVDSYSLGIVLYRLLNQNRIPFMPEAPKSITFHDRERAMAMRMRGEQIVKPFYAEGRLPEIVMKACAYNPKERYSSPTALRQELEAIQYDVAEAEVIYPTGDKIAAVENIYMSQIPQKYDIMEESGKIESSFSTQSVEDIDKTESVFDVQSVEGVDKTESVFATQALEDTDKTESVFDVQSIEGVDKTESVFDVQSVEDIDKTQGIFSCEKDFMLDEKVDEEFISKNIEGTEKKIEAPVIDVPKEKMEQTHDTSAQTISVQKKVSMKYIVIGILALLCVVGGVHVGGSYDGEQAEVNIEFSDLAVEKAIRDVLNMPVGTITQDDLNSITSFLDLSSKGISDIGALANLTNLTELNLSDNEISNIGALENLTNLTYLYLRNNKISDITPLSGLENLKFVSIHGNNIIGWTSVSHVKTVYK